MEQLPQILEGVAALLWPLIIAAVILIFRPAVHAIMETAKSRRFTLKIGGQELTMEEASQQQATIIADVQAQVLELWRRLDALAPSRGEAVAGPELGRASDTRAILWVDDHPKNNSFFVQQLIDLGCNVDLTLSTAEGLRKLSQRQYTLIISDLGRIENGVYLPTAGLTLLEAIRKQDAKVPFIIFASAQGVSEHRARGRDLGATAMTSSPTELIGLVERNTRGLTGP